MEKEMATQQRSLVGYNPWGRKESDTTERLTHTHRGQDLIKLCFMPSVGHFIIFKGIYI